MPCAHRYFLPNHVWHITHRCHQREFLLKFAHDRQRWMHRLFEARKRYALSVLVNVVTSNPIHVLVHDQGCGEIVQSMQLTAGCTAQDYNRRKAPKDAILGGPLSPNCNGYRDIFNALYHVHRFEPGARRGGSTP